MAQALPATAIHPRPDRVREAWGAAFVACAAGIAYIPSLSGTFIWNDSDYVTARALRSLRGLGLIWTKVGATQQYYPLLHSFFWIQHRLWSSSFPSRSQGNWTRTRPNSSVWISCPLGPTTVALCTPSTVGFALTSGGR